MKRPTKRHVTLASIGAVVAAVLAALTLVINWAVETNERLGASDNQISAFVQADSALFARDSLRRDEIKKINRRLGLKSRRMPQPPPPPPPKREGLFRKVMGLLF